jgi:hypothetical protein
VRRHYSGPLAVAHDLDFWDIGADAIEAGRLAVPDSAWGLTFGGPAVVAGPRGGGGASGGGTAES